MEAGEEAPQVSDSPGMATVLQRSSVDWATDAQPSTTSCLARPRKVCTFFHGKMMGGSSSMNYMVYMRGSNSDYDEYAKQGNTGWSWRDVLPYFRKSEDNLNLDLVDPLYHAAGG